MHPGLFVKDVQHLLHTQPPNVGVVMPIVVMLVSRVGLILLPGYSSILDKRSWAAKNLRSPKIIVGNVTSVFLFCINIILS
jgi:hypothetical protein